MTIDESIQQARYVADEHSDCWRNCENLDKCCNECEYEHEQLAEWLEELKFIKQWKSDIMEDFCRYDVSSFEELVTNARTKAIDDFLKEADLTFHMQNDGTAVIRRLENIANRLKGGVSSE